MTKDLFIYFIVLHTKMFRVIVRIALAHLPPPQPPPKFSTNQPTNKLKTNKLKQPATTINHSNIKKCII